MDENRRFGPYKIEREVYGRPYKVSAYIDQEGQLNTQVVTEKPEEVVARLGEQMDNLHHEFRRLDGQMRDLMLEIGVTQMALRQARQDELTQNIDFKTEVGADLDENVLNYWKTKLQNAYVQVKDLFRY